MDTVLASLCPPKDASLLLVNDSGWGGGPQRESKLVASHHTKWDTWDNPLRAVLLGQFFEYDSMAWNCFGENQVSSLCVKVKPAGLRILPSTNGMKYLIFDTEIWVMSSILLVSRHFSTWKVATSLLRTYVAPDDYWIIGMYWNDLKMWDFVDGYDEVVACYIYQDLPFDLSTILATSLVVFSTWNIVGWLRQGLIHNYAVKVMSIGLIHCPMIAVFRAGGSKEYSHHSTSVA